MMKRLFVLPWKVQIENVNKSLKKSGACWPVVIHSFCFVYDFRLVTHSFITCMTRSSNEIDAEFEENSSMTQIELKDDT